MRGDEFFAEVAHRPPFTKLHPQVAAFFKDYLANEKAVRFGGRFVVNTNFPPFPSRAFENLAEGFRSLGDAGQRRLFSVTLAVTTGAPTTAGTATTRAEARKTSRCGPGRTSLPSFKRWAP
jgi:hypothetical protein